MYFLMFCLNLHFQESLLRFNYASQCPPGLPYEISKNRCSSGEMDTLEGVMNNVRYERDDQGNYRTVITGLSQSLPVPKDVYGTWAQRGCSVAQPPGYPQYTDFNNPPPDRSAFKMICTDCVPDVYNTPNGIILQCNCPAY